MHSIFKQHWGLIFPGWALLLWLTTRRSPESGIKLLLHPLLPCPKAETTVISSLDGQWTSYLMGQMLILGVPVPNIHLEIFCLFPPTTKTNLATSNTNLSYLCTGNMTFLQLFLLLLFHMQFVHFHFTYLAFQCFSCYCWKKEKENSGKF